MAPLTVLHGCNESYDFSESSDKEDSPPLLPNQPTVTTMHDEDPAKLIAAITNSKHRHNLAFIENIGKVDQISCRAKTLMESTRLVAESMSTNTAAFMARLDGMDNNLAAIKCLLEELMASSAKLAEENATAMKSLLAQAVLFNKQQFKQGQAAFHRVQDVENLVTDFKLASATVTHALEESVPKTLQSVIEQNTPPTLQTILGEMISPTLRNVLEGTFTKFTLRYESVGGAVIREVQATLELQWESHARNIHRCNRAFMTSSIICILWTALKSSLPPTILTLGEHKNLPTNNLILGGHKMLTGQTPPPTLCVRGTTLACPGHGTASNLVQMCNQPMSVVLLRRTMANRGLVPTSVTVGIRPMLIGNGPPPQPDTLASRKVG
jgi:hypothetical protein